MENKESVDADQSILNKPNSDRRLELLDWYCDFWEQNAGFEFEPSMKNDFSALEEFRKNVKEKLKNVKEEESKSQLNSATKLSSDQNIGIKQENGKTVAKTPASSTSNSSFAFDEEEDTPKLKIKAPLPRVNQPRVARLDEIMNKNKKNTKKRLTSSPAVSTTPKIARNPTTATTTTSDPYTEDF
ncbi:DgyrCDS668 [Dimorphilus gyrociliatus]|uniref:DgyrCDS668 n=1 Tax=Dimorphilus gyrociliatus TaxID=2664684 RepID=A0A7I8V9W7_9ANNE|nr:DgyrCDS668 [Dimorphilus gyrociliatus]